VARAVHCGALLEVGGSVGGVASELSRNEIDADVKEWA
jgi:hypothetical protein